MIDPSNRSSPELAAEVPTPRNLEERLELANQLYREYRGQCFWHAPDDLVITEDLISFVVKGLRMYGGRRGFVLTGKLQPNPPDRATSDREHLECR
jgi:hypothetical protein